MRSVIVLLAFSACIVVCTAGIYRHDVLEEEYLKLGAEPQFDCVGYVVNYSTNDTLGSCVLIGDQFVLSAAHVFTEYGEPKVTTTDEKGRTMSMVLASSARPAKAAHLIFIFKGKTVEVDTIYTHPNYSRDNARISVDLALVRLKHSVAGVGPCKVNTQYNELNSVVVGVGYGASGNASEPESVDLQMKKIAGQNTIDSLTGFVVGKEPIVMLADFDHPSMTNCNIMGDAQPQPLEYIPAGGDSGGGLFRKAATGWELVGICTGAGVDADRLINISGYYGQLGGWTRVSVFSDWIREYSTPKALRK